ncbi:MAG TPA: hypothetical protein VFZ58_00885 [Candidatus Saccharimonadales bacterium]
MYKTFSAVDYKKHHNLPHDYTVHGFIIVGTFHPGPYAQLKEVLAEFGVKHISYGKVNDSPYFAPIIELTIEGKIYWFTIAYGGTILSEWVHLACLFGSQTNVVIGQCGGLFAEADTPDIIVPTYAYANESITRMYEPNQNHRHNSNEQLNQKLIKSLSQTHKVWHGPTMTCQAMMAETWEDIQQWSAEGYYGVEMEASTIFAVSNHFERRSAAVLVIGDNLVKQKTVHDVNYGGGLDARLAVRRDILAAVLKEVTGKV